MTKLTTEEQQVIICAVRYALGRRSTMPGTIAGHVVKKWPQLDTSTQKIIKTDISEYPELGDACDIDAWATVSNLP